MTARAPTVRCPVGVFGFFPVSASVRAHFLIGSRSAVGGGAVPKKVVTKCPVCGAPLRINMWSDELGNICEDNNDMKCNRIIDCEHYRWVRVGNRCLKYPDDPVCEGTEWLLKEAIDKVYDEAGVWLLVPSITDDIKNLEKTYEAVLEVYRLQSILKSVRKAS